MTPEPISNHVSIWGEGPIWHGDRLLYVDIEAHKILAFTPATGEEKVWNVGQRVGTVVPRAKGGLVWAGDDGFFFLDEATGVSTAIADPEPDLPHAQRMLADPFYALNPRQRCVRTHYSLPAGFESTTRGSYPLDCDPRFPCSNSHLTVRRISSLSALISAQCHRFPHLAADQKAQPKPKPSPNPRNKNFRTRPK